MSDKTKIKARTLQAGGAYQGNAMELRVPVSDPTVVYRDGSEIKTRRA